MLMWLSEVGTTVDWGVFSAGGVGTGLMVWLVRVFAKRQDTLVARSEQFHSEQAARYEARTDQLISILRQHAEDAREDREALRGSLDRNTAVLSDVSAAFGRLSCAAPLASKENRK